MKTASFRELVRATRYELNTPDTNAGIEDGSFEVDNAQVTLHFDENIDDDCMSVFVQVPDTESMTQNADVLRAMLMLNALSRSKTNGTFAMDPHTGQPVFTVQFTALEQFTGESLAATVRLLVAQGAGGINTVRAQLA